MSGQSGDKVKRSILLVANHGQIERMLLPSGWTEREAAPELDRSGLRLFYAPGTDNVQLRLGRRATEPPGRTVAAFARTLHQAGHELSDEEFQSLVPLFGDMADRTQFETVNARTIELNGRPVIWLEGRWLDVPFWSGTVFFPGLDHYGEVEDVTCFAALEDHEMHLMTFEQILSSMRWARPSL